MAVVSPPQRTRSFTTQPRNVEHQWNFNRENKHDENTNYSYPQTRNQTSQLRTNQNREALPNQPKSSWSNTTTAPYSNNRSAPDRLSGSPNSIEVAERLSDNLVVPRHKLGDLSRAGSEADSLLELYGQQKSGIQSSHNGAVEGNMVKEFLEDEDAERSRWIHRDKLAIIESQEARAAGIELPSENGMLDDYRNHENHNGIRHAAEILQSTGEGTLGGGKKRVFLRSPSPLDDAEEMKDSEELFQHDPRTPEEIAADPYEEVPHPPYSHNGLKSSSSRIPLSTSSPLPVPHEHLERSTLLPRKRGRSGNWEEDGFMYSKARSRSHSVGSQVLLDDGDPIYSSPTLASNSALQGSPTKPRQIGKSQAIAHNRNASVTKRAASGPNEPRSGQRTVRDGQNQRPATRSGLDDRPRTAINRPEGDPPWLATMYKPDPRLPPEQQILPTHAKRMQQEQWEREGKFGSAFDRDFTPVAVHPNDSPNTASQAEEAIGEKQAEESTSWPLRPVQLEPRKPVGNTTDHAGYSTTPTMQNMPNIDSPQNERVSELMQGQQSFKQEPEKEKGCACCTLM